MPSRDLKGFWKKLKENAVQEKDEVREIRSLGLETMKLPDKGTSVPQ